MNGLGEKGGPVTLAGGGPVGVKGDTVTNLLGVKCCTIVSSESSSLSLWYHTHVSPITHPHSILIRRLP